MPLCWKSIAVMALLYVVYMRDCKITEEIIVLQNKVHDRISLLIMFLCNSKNNERNSILCCLSISIISPGHDRRYKSKLARMYLGRIVATLCCRHTEGVSLAIWLLRLSWWRYTWDRKLTMNAVSNWWLSLMMKATVDSSRWILILKF